MVSQIRHDRGNGGSSKSLSTAGAPLQPRPPNTSHSVNPPPARRGSVPGAAAAVAAAAAGKCDSVRKAVPEAVRPLSLMGATLALVFVCKLRSRQRITRRDGDATESFFTGRRPSDAAELSEAVAKATSLMAAVDRAAEDEAAARLQRINPSLKNRLARRLSQTLLEDGDDPLAEVGGEGGAPAIEPAGRRMRRALSRRLSMPDVGEDALHVMQGEVAERRSFARRLSQPFVERDSGLKMVDVDEAEAAQDEDDCAGAGGAAPPLEDAVAARRTQWKRGTRTRRLSLAGESSTPVRGETESTALMNSSIGTPERSLQGRLSSPRRTTPMRGAGVHASPGSAARLSPALLGASQQQLLMQSPAANSPAASPGAQALGRSYQWKSDGTKAVNMSPSRAQIQKARDAMSAEGARRRLCGACRGDRQWMLSPGSRAVCSWTFFMDVLAISQFVVVPVAWAWDATGGAMSAGCFRFLLAAELLWCCDVLRTFRTGYRIPKERKVVMEPALVARKYAKGKLLFELLPLVALPLSLGGWPNALLLMLLRLLRFFFFEFSVADLFAGSMVSPILRLLQSMFFWLLCAHWVSCALHAMMITDEDGFEIVGVSQASVSETLCGENATGADALECIQKLTTEAYIWHMYTSVMMLIGQNDIKALTPQWRLFCLGVMFFGVVVGGTLFGHAAVLVASFNRRARQYNEKMDQVGLRLRELELPADVADSVRGYYSFVWDELGDFNCDHNVSGFSDKELPPSLHRRVLMAVYQPLLKQVPFFDGVQQKFIEELVEKLEATFFCPGDVIIEEGPVDEDARDMFFVVSGSVKVYFRETPAEVIRVLTKGDFFGEIGLLVPNCPRTATVEALGHCQLAKLSKRDLDGLMKLWPKYKQRFTSYVRRKKMVKNNSIKSSRMMDECIAASLAVPERSPVSSPGLRAQGASHSSSSVLPGQVNSSPTAPSARSDTIKAIQEQLAELSKALTQLER